jgi:hypothetical protein
MRSARLAGGWAASKGMGALEVADECRWFAECGPSHSRTLPLPLRRFHPPSSRPTDEGGLEGARWDFVDAFPPPRTPPTPHHPFCCPQEVAMQCSQPFRSLVALSQVRYPLAARLQRVSSVWNGAVGWLLVGWLVGLGGRRRMISRLEKKWFVFHSSKSIPTDPWFHPGPGDHA